MNLDEHGLIYVSAMKFIFLRIRLLVAAISLLQYGSLVANEQAMIEKNISKVKIPRIVGEYVNIYRPNGDVFPGPSMGELVACQRYEEWVPNDHCFVKDPSGRWHAFGITHPRTDLKQVHLGECLSFHALAPQGSLKETLKVGAWKDLPKVLPPSERPGERMEFYAPYTIRRDGLYLMIYGPAPIRYAVSKDLLTWTPKGTLENVPPGRDPNVLFYDGTYFLIVCGKDEVNGVTSLDFQHWKPHGSILTMRPGVDPESPTLIRFNGTFYLFVCAWERSLMRDVKNLQERYQHITYVYQSDNPLKFDLHRQLTIINAHAPEIIQDEQGDWYISSVEWPCRGVSLARLVWE